MNFLLYALLSVGAVGVLRFIRSKKIEKVNGQQIDLAVQFFIGGDDVSGKGLASSLLFHIPALADSIKELVVTDVHFHEPSISCKEFAKIIFQNTAAHQQIPDRSIGFNIPASVAEKRKESGIIVQIRGYLRTKDDKVSKFKLFRIAKAAM